MAWLVFFLVEKRWLVYSLAVYITSVFFAFGGFCYSVCQYQLCCCKRYGSHKAKCPIFMADTIMFNINAKVFSPHA